MNILGFFEVSLVDLSTIDSWSKWTQNIVKATVV
jgi:hypothetical protein